MTLSVKILLVDDDPNVLKGHERRLRKRFDIETVFCSEEALTAVNFLGPFAVIVSDMNMPRVNGIQLLKQFYEEAPESVRIMLTGNADQQTASDAINEGHVFRFLSKPCDSEELATAIEAEGFLDQLAFAFARRAFELDPKRFAEEFYRVGVGVQCSCDRGDQVLFVGKFFE